MSAKRAAPVEPEAPTDNEAGDLERITFVRDDDGHLTSLAGDVSIDLRADGDLEELDVITDTLLAFVPSEDRADVLRLLVGMSRRWRAMVQRADERTEQALDLAEQAATAPNADVVAVAAAAQRAGIAEGARKGYDVGRRDGVAAAVPVAAIERVERDESGRPVAVHSEFPDGTTRTRSITYGPDGKLATIETQG